MIFPLTHQLMDLSIIIISSLFYIFQWLYINNNYFISKMQKVNIWRNNIN